MLRESTWGNPKIRNENLRIVRSIDLEDLGYMLGTHRINNLWDTKKPLCIRVRSDIIRNQNHFRKPIFEKTLTFEVKYRKFGRRHPVTNIITESE